MNGIQIAFYDIGFIKDWSHKTGNYDDLLAITDIQDIRERSIPVFHPSPAYDQSHPGHALLIEYIERDAIAVNAIDTQFFNHV